MKENKRMSSLKRARDRHNTLAGDVTKAAHKRDEAIRALIRAEARYQDAIRAVSRSGKRIDKLREEANAAKELARKEVEQSKAEMPSIIV
jgi:hypothetical protein